MSSKIVGWLVGVRDGKILGLKKNPESRNKFQNKSGNGEYYIFAQINGEKIYAIMAIEQIGHMDIKHILVGQDTEADSS